jgi:hypothetical protein
MVLHIMIGQNPKKSIVKKNLHDVMLEYIFVKNMYVATY